MGDRPIARSLRAQTREKGGQTLRSTVGFEPNTRMIVGKKKGALDCRKEGSYWLAGTLLLVLASRASTGSESSGTHGHVLLSSLSVDLS
jgi:hypothetical protein